MRIILSYILCLLLFSISVFSQKSVSGKSTVKHIEFKQMVNEDGVRFMPELEVINLSFTDANGNQAADAGETGFLSMTIKNNGKGEANNVSVNIASHRSLQGLEFDLSGQIGTIYPGQSLEVYIPVNSSEALDDGTAMIKLEARDINNIKSPTSVLTIPTMRFRAPKVIIADAVFSTNSGDPVQLNAPVFLTLLVQNIGEGKAENVLVEFHLPDDCIPLGNSLQNLGLLNRGDARELQFSFVPTRNFKEENIPLSVKLEESHGEYAESTDLSVAIGTDLLAVNRSLARAEESSSGEIKIASLTAEVDKNIPTGKNKRENTLALIIGNEDYNSRVTGGYSETNVDFARNDAQIFKEYVTQTIGVNEKNVFLLVDATAAEMRETISLVSRLASKMGPQTEIIFYYAGHGLPDETNRTPYLIPVDVSGTNLSAAIPLKDIYAELGNSGAGKVSIFLDACFSGGARNAGLLAARAVRVKPKEELLPGKIVVFSASSNEQMALPYEEKQHGMFTYYLLKKLQETNGEVSYGELSEYLEQNVAIESLRVNKKDQDPKVDVSHSVAEDWVDWRL